MEKLLAEDARRDSAKLYKASVGSGQIGGKTETPFLETAETLKHTEDQDPTIIDYDGNVQMLESVRDFPSDTPKAQITGFLRDPNNHQAQSILTNSSIDQFKAISGSNRTHQKMSRNFNGKDFIFYNSQTVKSIKELHAEKAQVMKQRAQQVFDRKKSNPFGYKFFGLLNAKKPQQDFHQTYRSQEWNKLIVENYMHDKKPMKHTEKKNQITNQAFEEPPQVVIVPSIDSAISGYSRNTKEAAYHRTNQSSINMLRSFRTLDLEKKDEEYDVIPEVLGGVQLAQHLNRCSQLDIPTYGRKPSIPKEYISFKERQSVIHNVNNREVQSARMKNYTSTFIKEM